MGTSAPAIFHDDVARDVREHFLELLRQDRSAESSSDLLIEQWRMSIEDADDGPVFWLALAAIQFEYGCLQESVQRRAVQVIDDEADLRRWSGKTLERRRGILAELREKLLGPQPAPRRPRKRKKVEPPPRRVAISPEGDATAVAFTLDGDITIQVCVYRAVGTSYGGGSVFCAVCSLDDIAMQWMPDGSLQIAYPLRAKVRQQLEQSVFSGAVIPIRYRASE